MYAWSIRSLGRRLRFRNPEVSVELQVKDVVIEKILKALGIVLCTRK